MLALADDATCPGLHQVPLLEATGGVVCSSMPNLCLAANSRNLGAAIHVVPVLACVHFYY